MQPELLLPAGAEADVLNWTHSHRLFQLTKCNRGTRYVNQHYMIIYVKLYIPSREELWLVLEALTGTNRRVGHTVDGNTMGVVERILRTFILTKMLFGMWNTIAY